jgi:urea carboxylase
MDSWSLRLANLLVGNGPGAAGLECQFIGPTLRFHRDGVIALTGADMQGRIDGELVPMWQSIAVKQGQTLEMQFATVGARAYIGFAGGIQVAPFLGAMSTFHKAGVGGIAGHAIQAGQFVAVGAGAGEAGRRVKASARPPIRTDRIWEIEVVRGPNDDWVDDAGHERFLNTDWKLSAKSDRSGFRLEGGADWTFTSKAHDKAPEHGSEPSNIIDQAYPPGAINIAGQTPIILVNDAPSAGGFINPYTVPQCAFWKMGQSRPAEIYRFREVSITQAQTRAREITALCSEASIE